MTNLSDAAQKLAIVIANMSKDSLSLHSELQREEYVQKRTLEYRAASSVSAKSDDRVTLKDGRVCIGLRK